YHKGLMMVPLSDLYPAMKAIANENTPALNSYRKYGYVRAEDDAESVSKTLEYAYDDWCIAQMALTVGDIPAYDSFGKRSKNWMNVYDPQTGWMRPRKNSAQMIPFSPYMVDNHFTEANSFQYSFYVPHDIEEYTEMIGGKDSMDRKLDQLFTASSKTEGREQADITGLTGQYAHGNEPSHHIPFLYNDRAKRNKIVDHIREKFYTTEPDGLIGNEDCGAMSAWYVWAAMGMYPICPGSKEIAT
ncbi:MAG: glycoside hydrolase domain-containing protein, partial [Chitinophagales bacterium]